MNSWNDFVSLNTTPFGIIIDGIIIFSLIVVTIIIWRSVPHKLSGGQRGGNIDINWGIGLMMVVVALIVFSILADMHIIPGNAHSGAGVN
jgi:hypothetical protein